MKEWAGDGLEELLAMERLRDLEMLTPYGFTERPPGGDGQNLQRSLFAGERGVIRLANERSHRQGPAWHIARGLSPGGNSSLTK